MELKWHKSENECPTKIGFYIVSDYRGLIKLKKWNYPTSGDNKDKLCWCTQSDAESAWGAEYWCEIPDPPLETEYMAELHAINDEIEKLKAKKARLRAKYKDDHR